MAVVLGDGILRCEGYEMFRGSFLVTPKSGAPFRVSGDWLHIPPCKNDGYDIWYVKGQSFPAEILSDRVVY